MKLLFDPVVPVLGMNPKKPKALSLRNICNPMFMAALALLLFLLIPGNY